MEKIRELETLIKARREQNNLITSILKTHGKDCNIKALADFALKQKHHDKGATRQCTVIAFILLNCVPMVILSKQRLPKGVRNEIAEALNITPCKVSKYIAIASVRYRTSKSERDIIERWQLVWRVQNAQKR